jgi:hypothetical protein
MKVAHMSETVAYYVDGFNYGFYYYRTGNRIFLLKDAPIPVGITVKPETERFEKNVFQSLFGEMGGGVSYEVEGWANGPDKD